jgi:formate/nitrite transporter FocA (FNT family)
MYVAVYPFQPSRKIPAYLGIFLCVPTFILSGFEHSIADMFFFAAGLGGSYGVGRALGHILLVTLGNGLGAVLFGVASRYVHRVDGLSRGQTDGES